MIKPQDCNNMIDVFNSNYKTPKTKFLVIWMLLTIVVFFIILELFHMNNLFTPQTITQYDVYVWLIMIPIIGTGLLIYRVWHPKKATYNIVFQDLYNLIKVNETIDLSYQVKPTEFRKLNKEVLLFSSATMYSTQYAVKSYIDDYIPYTLFYGSGIVQAGQNSSQVFKGLYYIIPNKHPFTFQIRSKGKPPRKTNLVKAHELNNLTLYIDKDQSLTYTMKQLLAYYEQHFNDPYYKNVYIAGFQDTLHVAYESPYLPKTLSSLTCEQINLLYDTFIKQLNDVSIYRGFEFDFML